MQVRLQLKRTHKGVPVRLQLTCPQEYREYAYEAGRGTGRWNKTGTMVTYPVDPAVIKEIARLLPDVIIDKELYDYLESLKQKQNEIFTAINTTEPLDVEDNLWDFQRGSVRFLESVGKGILAHQMGTGKTVIASKAIDVMELDRVVVVCPNSVKWSWVDHLHEWAARDDIFVLESGKAKDDPYDRADILCGSQSERSMLLAKFLTENSHFCLVMNYDQLRMHEKVLSTADYDVCIADEAHRLKNKAAKWTQSAFKMSSKCKYFWLLTGTPIRNDYNDYWSLLRLCDPLRFGSYWNFVNFYLKTIPGHFGGVEIVGQQKELAPMLTAYMYRVTKEEAMPHLPKKIHTDIRLPLNPTQAKVYETMEEDFIMAIKKQLDNGVEISEILRAPTVVAQLIRLRQICLSPAIIGGEPDSAKLDALDEMLRQDFKPANTQLIIYTWFKQFLVYIEMMLRRLRMSYALVVGGQKSGERDAAEKKLREGDVQVILGTISSMGEGMNLQTATTAIFTDIDWVPAVNEQAEDRIHRGEIKVSPTIIKLYHPNTVESDIRATCKRKERKADETVGVLETLRNMMARHGETV